MVDIDSETLFNGAAAAVATIAVLVFLLNVDFPYSPATKYALAVGFLVGVFAITQRTDDYQLALFGYAAILVSAVALFFQLVNNFDLGNTATVLGLLVIAAVIFSLRSLLDGGSQFVSGRRATAAFGVIAVVVVLVLVVDVATGGLAYELQPQSQVEFEGDGERRYGGQARIGTMVVSNPTPLPERVDTPRYESCAVGNWSAYRLQPEPEEPPRPVHLHLRIEDSYNEHVFGFGSKSYPVVLNAEINASGDATFPVEMTDSCPGTETGSPYVAVFPAPEDRPYYRAV